jgi:HEAT repeat protein
VAIRTSSATQIDALVAALSAANTVTREAAIARLTVIGPRAIARLVALATSAAEPVARVAAFAVLEAIADPRAIDPALGGLDDADAAVAAAAVAVTGVFLRGPRGATVVDRLTAMALDPARPEPLRVAALTALGGLSRATMDPVLTALAGDPSATIRAEAEVQRTGWAAAPNPLEALTRAAEDGLPDDPDALRAVIVRAGETAPLPLLLRIVERAREREPVEPARRRPAWTTARVAAHAALARRGSRLALYDMRELLEGAKGPLPVEFLAALSQIGDASCLEAVAGAYARSSESGPSRHDWWRQRLADAFRAIVAREGINRRHAVAKRIEKRWPGTWALVVSR